MGRPRRRSYDRPTTDGEEATVVPSSSRKGTGKKPTAKKPAARKPLQRRRQAARGKGRKAGALVIVGAQRKFGEY